MLCVVFLHTPTLLFVGQMAAGVKERALCPILKTRVQMYSWGLKKKDLNG